MAQEAISQPAKIPYENFATLLSASSLLFVSTSLFFWFLTYSSEFDSNSSGLDRLDNFGINSLQKLQI